MWDKWEPGRQIGKRAAEGSAYHVRGCLWMPLAISLSAVIAIVSVLTGQKYSPTWRMMSTIIGEWWMFQLHASVSREDILDLYITHPSGVARQQFTPAHLETLQLTTHRMLWYCTWFGEDPVGFRPSSIFNPTIQEFQSHRRAAQYLTCTARDNNVYVEEAEDQHSTNYWASTDRTAIMSWMSRVEWNCSG